MNRIKVIVLLLVLFGFCCLVFGIWGIYTPAGRTRFDEMDGLYPMAALAVGIADIVAAILLALIMMRRS